MSRTTKARSCLFNLELAMGRAAEVPPAARFLRHWLVLAAQPETLVSDDALAATWRPSWSKVWEELGVAVKLDLPEALTRPSASRATEAAFGFFDEPAPARLVLGGRTVPLAGLSQVAPVASAFSALGLRFVQTGDRYAVLQAPKTGAAAASRLLVTVAGAGETESVEVLAGAVRLVAPE